MFSRTCLRAGSSPRTRASSALDRWASPSSAVAISAASSPPSASRSFWRSGTGSWTWARCTRAASRRAAQVSPPCSPSVAGAGRSSTSTGGGRAGSVPGAQCPTWSPRPSSGWWGVTEPGCRLSRRAEAALEEIRTRLGFVHGASLPLVVDGEGRAVVGLRRRRGDGIHRGWAERPRPAGVRFRRLHCHREGARPW